MLLQCGQSSVRRVCVEDKVDGLCRRHAVLRQRLFNRWPRLHLLLSSPQPVRRHRRHFRLQ